MNLRNALQQLAELIPSGMPDAGPATRFINMNTLSAESSPQVHRGDLLTLDQFAPVFEAHIERGPPWVNLSLIGLLDGSWVVGMELPTMVSSRKWKTSVNFSGPTRAVLKVGGRLDPVLRVID